MPMYATLNSAFLTGAAAIGGNASGDEVVERPQPDSTAKPAMTRL
jgi:hypothetical protein